MSKVGLGGLVTLLVIFILSLSGCGVLQQVWPRLDPTPTVAPTRTPVPLPTLAPTATRTTVPPTATATTRPTTVPTNPPPAPPTAPPAPQAPRVSNFTARFTGRTIEGSFNVGTEVVTYIYRIQRLDVVGNRLQASGALTYTRANGASGTVGGLTTLVTTEGDACERITLDTNAVDLPEWGITLPAQQVKINLAEIQGNANPAIGAMCQLARAVQANPNNPIVGFLLGQVNRQLAQ